ncbi:MAG: transposase [Victivallales bacterium]|nr:transposase [Victivallales bacterium]
MANSMIKIDVHLIFHIKSTSVQMQQCDLPQIFSYIGGILRDIGSIPIIIGGIPDHIHTLVALPSNMTISELVRTTKAKSSKWIKTLSPYYSMFAWQDGYGAFSVSPSILDKTINYIKNQENHHRTKSFQEEYMAFLKAYKIPYDEKYIFND